MAPPIDSTGRSMRYRFCHMGWHGSYPQEQSTKVHFAINLRNAKAIGLTFLLTLLGRPDEELECGWSLRLNRPCRLLLRLVHCSGWSGSWSRGANGCAQGTDLPQWRVDRPLATAQSTAEDVKGFGCRPMTDGAANTEAGGRRPKASKERNRGKWHAVVPGALWRFERGRRGA
jgi:hypothetical protein